MTDTATLLALAERCEQAEGPDRELDELISAEIQDAVREVMADGRTAFHSLDGAHWVSVAIGSYTASLDAALTLMPEGWVYIDFRRFDDGSVGCDMEAIGVVVSTIQASAATPALALCAAALRSRANQEDTK